MGKSSAPQHAHYEEMQDTPWITQGRDIANIGGEGLKKNANSVNVFDDQTKYEINKLNRDVYSRAQEDLNKQYLDTMNKYASANYNRFGSLNSTPSSYITDQYQRQYQRDAANLAYERAKNYEDLYDQELKRRYDTLNEYYTLYNLGQIPYQQDISNWQIRNKNKDIDYQNAMTKANARLGSAGIFGSLASLGMQGLQAYLGSKSGGLASGALGSLGSSVGSGLLSDVGSGGWTGDGAISSGLSGMFGNY